MLETYVTPILMSYVNRYIKNLKPSDLQLSLWGGDVVLNQLELKLEVLEQELKLPFTFLRGHIHELRIHVPWTKLGSEPVVVTINTIECILKLKDSTQPDEHESANSDVSTGSHGTDLAVGAVRARRLQHGPQADADLASGYVQSLMRRVVNNVSVLVNNLILKYVEDDIVLSVNVKAAECYTVDEFWERAFNDISAQELVLRKVINFSDCTVCLDKRNASGKIDVYQDPLIYKCSFRTRLHFTYGSISAKMPTIVKIHTLCESLSLSVTDQQLPMFIRIIQLAIALYYGEIEQPESTASDKEDHWESITTCGDGKIPLEVGDHQSLLALDAEGQQGWTSWAWSFVPAIVSYVDEEDEDFELYDDYAEHSGIHTRGILSQRPRPPKEAILSVGFYITRFTVVFKVTENHVDSAYYSPGKVSFKPILKWIQEGTAIDVLMKGEPFFDCQMGFVNCCAMSLNNIMGVHDCEDSAENDMRNCFLKCGDSLSNTGPRYLTASLFDYRSAENNGVHAIFILDKDKHMEAYTKEAGMQRFGAAFLDYLYTIDQEETKGFLGHVDEASSKGEDIGSARESSSKRFVLGHLDIQLDSSAVHRLAKLLLCATDHEYEPYSKPRPEIVDESRDLPSTESVAALESFVSTRKTSISILGLRLSLVAAEFNLLPHLMPSAFSDCQQVSPAGLCSPTTGTHDALPAFEFLAKSVVMHATSPMYPRRLVQVASSLGQLSQNILDHCYVRYDFQVFGLQADLRCIASGMSIPTIPIMPPFSMVFSFRQMQMPVYWTRRILLPLSELTAELPSLCVRLTRAEMSLLEAVTRSWARPGTPGGLKAAATPLFHAFGHPGGKVPGGQLGLEVSFSKLDLKACNTVAVWALSGTLASFEAHMHLPGTDWSGEQGIIPLFQGPTSTAVLYRPNWLHQENEPEFQAGGSHFVTLTLQIPHDMSSSSFSTGAMLLLNIEGAALNLDPMLHTWLFHQPSPATNQSTEQTVEMPLPAGVLPWPREGVPLIGANPLGTRSQAGSEKASSPVKTKTVTGSRILNVPGKPLCVEHAESLNDERSGWTTKLLWDSVKCLTLQFEMQPWCVFAPRDSLTPSNGHLVKNAVPRALHTCYRTARSPPGILVLSLPYTRVLSAGHKYIAPLQGIPLAMSQHVQQEGDAFPWTLNLENCSSYTIMNECEGSEGQESRVQAITHSLMDPTGCTCTLAVTASPTCESQRTFAVCLHVDLQPMEMALCNAQVLLVKDVLGAILLTLRQLHQSTSGRHRVSLGPEMQGGSTANAASQPAVSSPVQSSKNTAQLHTSSCSYSADVCTTPEEETAQLGEDCPLGGTDTLEQRTSLLGANTRQASLWLQCVLPRLSIRLFAPAQGNVCVLAELEELSTSIDIQDIYTKIKCKISSFNVDHFRKRPGGSWDGGKFAGLLLQCKHKHWVATSIAEVAQQHGFLAFTYTRALTRNVRQRLSSRSGSHCHGSSLQGDVAANAPDAAVPKYLHEVLLRLQPFDMVLHFPTLVAAASIFYDCRSGKVVGARGSEGQPVRGSSSISSRSLPLLYVNTGSIRVFISQPKEECAGSPGEEDTVVLKIDSVMLSPQADNPLTRTVLRKDIYQQALTLGVLREPGSEVEDRQYQLDLCGLNVSTACWAQVRPEAEDDQCHNGVGADTERVSQNPALEWNMASSMQRIPERRAFLTPLLLDVAIRLTAAPAIVFTKKLSAESALTEEVLVCGHSLEINVTSSLDFLLRLAQLHLLQQLLHDNLPNTTSVAHHAEGDQKLHWQTTVPVEQRLLDRASAAKDSGIGSDSMGLQIVQVEHGKGKSRHRLACVTRQSSVIKNQQRQPFEIFLTAGRISLMTYTVVSGGLTKAALLDPSCHEIPAGMDSGEENVQVQATNASETPSKIGRHSEVYAVASESSSSDGNSTRSAVFPGSCEGSTFPLPSNSFSNLIPNDPGIPLCRPHSSVHAPSRGLTRNTLGPTVVRQMGRKGGDGTQRLEPFFYLLLQQPSLLLSCQRRTQKFDVSCFDVCLKASRPDYTVLDPGKVLPEPEDYGVFWLQSTAGETDSRTGVPPAFFSLRVQDFLNGPAGVQLETGRPWRVSPSPRKLEQLTRWMCQFRAPLPRDTAGRQRSVEAQGASLWLPRALASIRRVSIKTRQVVVAGSCDHPESPGLTLSVQALTCDLDVKRDANHDLLEVIDTQVDLIDAVVQTHLLDRTQVFCGPCRVRTTVEARWCKHSGAPQCVALTPKLLLYINTGLLQVFCGQEQVRCIHLLHYLLKDNSSSSHGPTTTDSRPSSRAPTPLSSRGTTSLAPDSQVSPTYLDQEAIISATPPSLSQDLSGSTTSTFSKCHSFKPEAYSLQQSIDDLRMGLFQYIPNIDGKGLLPNDQEVVFTSESEDRPATMLWRYSEPRMLTYVHIAPVPFNTTEDLELSTADLGDVLQVPCSLEYFDELKQRFVPCKEFSLSESRECELLLPSPFDSQASWEHIVTAQLWRVVLNIGSEGLDEHSMEEETVSQGSCDPLVSALALAACMRVDSCFSPCFVPALEMSIRCDCLQLKIVHHMDCLGSAQPLILQPFTFQGKGPPDHEFLTLSLACGGLVFRHWTGSRAHVDAQLSGTLSSQILEYRNLTMSSFVKPVGLHGHLAWDQTVDGESDSSGSVWGQVALDAVELQLGQCSLHTLELAARAWLQIEAPSAEQLIFSHFVICNDTQETLCLGQVDTDENVLLCSREMLQYCWRSHKVAQLLHICIEGWGNWRWSDPFSLDTPGTLLRNISNKGRVASLIISVISLGGLQKQIIIKGRQVICSYLDVPVQLGLSQSYIGLDGKPITCEFTAVIPANEMLPSYVMENTELSAIRIKIENSDWSESIYPTSSSLEQSTVLKVSCSEGISLQAWCSLLVCDEQLMTHQHVVVLSPLFVMGNHLPEPLLLHTEKRSLGKKHVQRIVGQGQEVMLNDMEADLTHHLSFQLGMDGEASESTVPISTALIKQISDRADTSPTNLNYLLTPRKQAEQHCWPYADDLDSLMPETPRLWDNPMQVKLSAWKPGLKSLLVELLPWALLINHSSWDLWIFEGEKVVVQVPAGSTVVPPVLQEPFQIGIYYSLSNTVHKSSAIQLVREGNSSTQHDGLIALHEEGACTVDVQLGNAPGMKKLCQLTLRFVARRGMLLLCVSDCTMLLSDSAFGLRCWPFMTNGEPNILPEHVPSTDSSVLDIPAVMPKAGALSCPISCWDIPNGNGFENQQNHRPVFWLCLAFSSPTGAEPPVWSRPVLVSTDLVRQSVAVPAHDISESPFCTRPLLLIWNENLGVNYLNLTLDPCPRMLIYNHCSIPIQMKEVISGVWTFPIPRPVVPPDGAIHHELAHHLLTFPECRPHGDLPTARLHQPHGAWSDEFHLGTVGTQVVMLPEYGCLYVEISFFGGTLTFSVAPESKAGLLTSLHRSPVPQASPIWFQFLLLQLSVAINDDVSQPTMSSEFLRLSLDDALLTIGPGTMQEGSGASEPIAAFSNGSSLELLVGNVQLDNQLFPRSAFHFPVILCRGEQAVAASSSASAGLGHSFWPLESTTLEHFRQSCAIQMKANLAPSPFSGRTEVTDLELEFQPLQLYIEDTFLYHLKMLLATFSLSLCRQLDHPQGQTALIEFPQLVSALVLPIRLRHFTIRPLNLLVSVHASLRLYIASDQTPLSFSAFERHSLFTTPRELIHALTMHYAAGALFRAGWVVGSLEILGSPGSLVCSLANGVADFFRLPYEGLTRGPGAFVSGVSRGTSSFVRHISKGTLTSITNLATSLARNMDRLSLDHEHFNRQEEGRQQLPETVVEGFRQGLSRLGLSLLGAIAGIVDQPLQGFHRASTRSRTRNVISGVGKGLLGVFTKPIGGAAELISQTGYGILHGAGLSQIPRQRTKPREASRSMAVNSHTKYVWKMLQSMGQPEVLMALDVKVVSGAGLAHEGCLLLTEEVLFVTSVCEDAQQQAFLVTATECQQREGQPGLLQVLLRTPAEPEEPKPDDNMREKLSEQQYERLVEYVRKSTHYISTTNCATPNILPVAVAHPPVSPIKMYEFFADPLYLHVFLSRFHQAKSASLHKGF
uniref:intermembrane lipid transfer protein VPS13B isoform X2 n=1 Tax=Myxine glutinosa TaxID=7769 RepID=UPI00358FB320